MMFKQGTALYAKEVERKEGESILYVNYFGDAVVPSIADSPEVMARTIDALIENSNVSRVIFVQQRNYNYSFEQVGLLLEIAQLYNFLVKQERVLSAEKTAFYSGVQNANKEIEELMFLLRADPVGCWMQLNRRISELKRLDVSSGVANYLRFLERLSSLISGTKLLQKLSETAETYAFGDREVYSNVFRADTMPNFTFTRLVAAIPEDSELVDQYDLNVDDEIVNISIFRINGQTRNFYHVMPPEYSLSEEHHYLLNLARNVLLEHEPKAEEFTDPARVREVFFNVARDLLSELSKSKNISLNYRELNRLAKVLVRQTIGVGLIEVLLMDEKLQDIFLNAPIAKNPVYVRHSEYEECVTNIIPSYEDADSWAAKLRLQSGRPLDEANPILDTDLVFGKIRARVAAIQRPLSPDGLAYAIRRHRDQPWTLPLFIHKKMLTPFAAGLLSFLIDGNRTLLIAGTRSSGKTSLLGSLMLEVMPKVRTIVIEDTLELPVDYLRNIGYNVQRMKVRSALTESTTEIEAAEGIRASLRLGDSALIVGEVRSSEAKALYEAMRVGALANVVAGTIHGASPYGVFDRIVNDLGVPVTSFKATDLVVVANPIKSADGLHSRKRIVQIAEVRKNWTHDPTEEKGFVDLMTYNVEKDELEPSDALVNGESEIVKSIASNVKGWAGNWDAVYDNIVLRGKIKQEIVDTAIKMKKLDLMEAKFNALSNEAFHIISENVAKEFGLPLSEKVFPLWKKWLSENAGKF